MYYYISELFPARPCICLLCYACCRFAPLNALCVDFFGFGRLPSIGEMFEPLRTLSEHEPEAEMHEEADPLEAKAEEKGEEALGHKGEEPSVREDAYPLEAEAEENAEEAFEQRRELNALRHKMHQAVEEEDFETAIELRDMIRKMENK